MLARAALLLLLATAATALEPEEVYTKAAKATVLIEAGGKTGAGVILDAARGLILTHDANLVGKVSPEVELRSGIRAKARLLRHDPAMHLALLQTGDLRLAGVGALALAPLIKSADETPRIYAVGHRVRNGKFKAGWVLSLGVVSHVRAPAVPALGGLVLIEHDAALNRGHTGGPLTDGEGRLLGILVDSQTTGIGEAEGGWAIPVNAVARFLVESRERLVSAADADALPVFDPERAPMREPGPARLEPVPPPPEAERSKRDLPPSAQTPKGMYFGPYPHYLRSRAMADLKVRTKQLLGLIEKLYFRCSRCRGRGSIRVEIAPRRWDPAMQGWRLAIYETRACPRCEGRKRLFDDARADAFLLTAFSKEQQRHRRFDKVERLWRVRLQSIGSPAVTRLGYELDGLHGFVTGNGGVLPLELRVRPHGDRHRWFLLEAMLEGPDFVIERPPLPERGEVTAVFAGDMIEIDGAQIVRICGITIPDSGNNRLRKRLHKPLPAARATVLGDLLGKTVGLSRDKYATMTLDGHDIAFIELDGRDYGEDLVRRGIARLHPKHAHMRKPGYMKVESAARRSGAGVWRK